MIEDDYKNDPWWLQMKQRMETKSEKQIELDRKLLEETGAKWDVNGQSPKPNLDEIYKLISLGAQPDHWVEQDMGQAVGGHNTAYGRLSAVATMAFLGRTHFCTTHLRIWYVFGQETYIYFVDQETRIIEKLFIFNFFINKGRNRQKNNSMIMLVSWATKRI